MYLQKDDASHMGSPAHGSTAGLHQLLSAAGVQFRLLL
jgi:hypothetical protein